MLKVYNTLTRKLEVFKPLKGKKVKMFVCGLTPYDSPHIGHAKTYVAFDIIARYLRYKGYDVYYLQNVTDVEDRLIERSKKSGESVDELVKKFMREYFDSMRKLNVQSVSEYAYATHHMQEIIEQIQGLLKKGYAYELEDGVYFNISKFKDYGKLSGQSPEEARRNRIEPNPKKKNLGDFALWKRQKPGEPAWDSPFGRGRPGWHIEDTAITIGHFGPQYDVHGGANELIFPHHEAEIAQAEAFTGKKPFVKYWLHTGVLNVKGQKMSKSLGNFVTITEALRKYDPDALRFFYVQIPYGSPIDYEEGHLEEARKSLDKIQNMLGNLIFLLKNATDKFTDDEKRLEINSYRERFLSAMDNNFNTSEALSVAFELVREVNKLITENKLYNSKKINEVLAFFYEISKILGLRFRSGEEGIPREIMKLVDEREKARRKKDWKAADEVRQRIKNKGYWVDDTPKGPKITKLS